jgi:hypothetical protein
MNSPRAWLPDKKLHLVSSGKKIISGKKLNLVKNRNLAKKFKIGINKWEKIYIKFGKKNHNYKNYKKPNFVKYQKIIKFQFGKKL